MKKDSHDSPEPSVTEEDLLAILEYVDGRMSSAEQIELELRFSQEPALAAAFEAFEKIDSLERRYLKEQRRAPARPEDATSPATRSIFRFLRGGRGLSLLAAAAVILAIAGTFNGWFGGDPSAPRPGPSKTLRVAVLATGPTVVDFNRSLKMPADRRHEVPETWKPQPRGETQPPPVVSDQEYRRHVEPLLELRVRRALRGELAPEEAGVFLLPLDLEGTVSIIVLVIDDRGETLGLEGQPFAIAFPDVEPWDERSGRKDAGRHLLPFDPLERLGARGGDPDEQSFSGGFVTSWQGGATTVLVAARIEPLDEALRKALEAQLTELEGLVPEERRTRSRLREWLTERGFDLRELTVIGKE